MDCCHVLWLYPIVQKMLLNYLHSVLASPMQECRSVPAQMVAFVHVIYCCFLSFCRPVTTSLPYVIVITDSRSDRSNNNMSSCSRDSKKFWVLVSIKYFSKIMYYMESGSTGNSTIPVNLVMINVVIFA